MVHFAGEVVLLFLHAFLFGSDVVDLAPDELLELLVRQHGRLVVALGVAVEAAPDRLEVLHGQPEHRQLVHLPRHRLAGGDHRAQLADVGVHLVPPPLLDLAVVLSQLPRVVGVFGAHGCHGRHGTHGGQPGVLQVDILLPLVRGQKPDLLHVFWRLIMLTLPLPAAEDCLFLAYIY